jgi:two-component system, NtrC family, response regulator HydG
MTDTLCAAMLDLMEQVRRVAPLDTTILLAGETGTGKTRLARLIHQLSPRRDEPFLVIHCGALVENLIESEMFGHVKGAFTGAARDRTGKFAEAGRGTLLLDDIDALPLALQAKLLRAIEERVFEPVGSNLSQPVKGRIIATSQRALQQEVENGRFRADLYYRLNVISFSLPPLRERPGEIANLVTSFIADIAARHGRPVHGICATALDVLETYTWPGNIRELRNVIERAVALCRGCEIQLDDLPEAICSATAIRSSCIGQEGIPAPTMAGALLSQVGAAAERVRICAALQEHHNNRTRAAAALGINRRTLYKKLDRYGLRTGREP